MPSLHRLIDGMRFTWEGRKVGYVSDIMQKDGDVIKSRNEFVMQIKRAGQSIEITVEQETTEKISGELIEFFK